jgi:hypothetical protein
LPIADIEIFAIVNRQFAIGNRQRRGRSPLPFPGLIKVLRSRGRDNMMASDRSTIARQFALGAAPEERRWHSVPIVKPNIGRK